MTGLSLNVREEVFPVAGVFSISRGSRTEIRVVTVELNDGVHRGRGECVPYARYDESVESVRRLIRSVEGELAAGMNRADLQDRLPSGAARNGLDCAFWDLEAKRAGTRVWELAGLSALQPVTTSYTLSLASPGEMRRQAEWNAHRPVLKVKLGAEGDLERIEAVRQGAPVSTIIIDANEGWSVEQYRELSPALVQLGVAMVEQPLPADADDALAEIERPIPVCADESCHDRASLAHLKGKYDLINIKIDKTGGLTEALALKREAEAAGLGVMVGCMLGTSLAMAPALLLACDAQFVDLDGPLLLAADRPAPLQYAGSLIAPAHQNLWG